MGTDARIAAVTTLASAMRSTTENVRAMCKLDPTCDYSALAQHVTIGGRNAYITYGWLGAGYALGADEIDVWVDYSGFTASVPTGEIALFTLDGSPNPANCSVKYDAPFWRGPTGLVVITATTSGC